MKTGRAITAGGRAFRTLLYTLLAVLLLAASAAAISKRSEVFVGYAEKNEQHSKCSDSMDAEVCASYKELPHVQNRYVPFHIKRLCLQPPSIEQDALALL